MPTYDYLCERCQHRFEHFQPMSDEPLRTCPSCRRKGLRRLIGAGGGIIFKGGGFYETDYKRAPAGADATPAKDGQPSPGSAPTPEKASPAGAKDKASPKPDSTSKRPATDKDG